MELDTDLTTQADILSKNIRRFTGVAWGAVVFGFAAGALGVFMLNTQQLGELGDYLAGATGVLFSFAAFLFVYVAFQGQSIQLLYQRQEVRNTRDAADEQAKSVTAQLKVASKQGFEQTFFQMINLHHELVRDVRLSSAKPGHVKQWSGRDTFSILYKRYKDCYDETPSNWHPRRRVKSAYIKFYRTNQYKVGHYFRNMYHIVRFVDESEVEEKRRYTNILRAQLSVFELTLLFYNGLSKWGINFKPLIQTYGLLHNLPRGAVIDEDHRALYVQTAFAGSDGDKGSE